MANEMRDRLVEVLLQKTCHYSDTPCDKECGVCGNIELYRSDVESIADHLIENGVVVPQWTSVKDRLPETNGKYLCAEYSKTFKKQYLNVSRFARDLYKVDKHDFCDEKGKSGFYGYSSEWGYFKESDITHWMPLPEPPKAEQKLKEMRGRNG